MTASPRDYTTVLLLTIFLGVLGVHRFVVGKVGTGILYFFTYGVFLIGWIVDIITVASGSFTDKQGRVVTWKKVGGPSATARTFTPSPDEGLEFVVQGKAPERDKLSRVIARLGPGSQFLIPLHWVDDADIDAITSYFRGSRKLEEGDGGTITRRFRLVPVVTDYWGGKCFRVETPSGIPAFEIRDYFEDRFGLTTQIVTDATEVLRGLDLSLANAPFVFDVGVRADYEVATSWDIGSEEDSGDDGNDGRLEWEVSDPTVRLRNPLKIQILSEKKV